jgi:hypothetical protein
MSTRLVAIGHHFVVLLGPLCILAAKFGQVDFIEAKRP